MIFYYFIYLLLSAITLLLMCEKNLKIWLMKMIIVSFLPIIGWFLPSIWPARIFKTDPSYFPSYMDKQMNDLTVELKGVQQSIRKDKELNVISIEEVLLINDYTTRRRVLIDVLKEDALKYIDILKNAVLNEDSETSHYAVTAITEVKRELTILLQQLAVKYSEAPTDPKIANTYADVVKEYLRSGFLDERTTRQYQILYTQILGNIISSQAATEVTFENKINMEIALKDYPIAEITAKQFITAFPLCEIGYIKLMEIYFELRSYNRLKEKIHQLKTTPIILSNQAMTLIRYWAEVDNKNEMDTR